MAKVASEFPQGNGRQPMYPYETWIDGQVWHLVGGEDFKVAPEGMRSSLHNYAKKAGITVKTKIRDGDVWVQLVEPEEDPEVEAGLAEIEDEPTD